mmetsp:Transcript_42959/g.99593  ORF Transcript_42959/g.99593 Transcript_42959/m.99593 type:complete len:226 (+) Transcript_42959:640-1317(+)
MAGEGEGVEGQGRRQGEGRGQGQGQGQGRRQAEGRQGRRQGPRRHQPLGHPGGQDHEGLAAPGGRQVVVRGDRHRWRGSACRLLGAPRALYAGADDGPDGGAHRQHEAGEDARHRVPGHGVVLHRPGRRGDLGAPGGRQDRRAGDLRGLRRRARRGAEHEDGEGARGGGEALPEDERGLRGDVQGRPLHDLRRCGADGLERQLAHRLRGSEPAKAPPVAVAAPPR